MKVIQIMDNFIVEGGVNSFVYDLCYALKEQGCDVLSLDYYVRDMIQIQKSKILGMLELELNALAHRVKRGL
ncbi:MAG: hypothetical protein ACLRY7_08105 [Hominenteromicrobium sp.]|uniref:hypothetical protein n=1 Tax=Hominenteromicrobium sp. TaxID=3073581 RepID=UPI0039A038CE